MHEKLKGELNQIMSNCEGSSHGLRRISHALLRELKLFDNCSNSVYSEDLYSSHTKLQIGGGTRLLEGFLNVDVCPPADLVWDVREGLPFKDEQFKFTFSEHFLEHIDYPVSVKKVVSELYRTTVSKGEVVIGVPDAGLVAKEYSKANINFQKDLVDRWYGKRDCKKHINTSIDLVNYVFADEFDHPVYTPHLWGYDYEKLEDLMLSAGFSRVEIWEPDMSLVNPKRIHASVYIKATK